MIAGYLSTTLLLLLRLTSSVAVCYHLALLNPDSCRLLRHKADIHRGSIKQPASLCDINLSPDIVGAEIPESKIKKLIAQLRPQDDIKFTNYANIVRSARLSSGNTYRYVFRQPFNTSMPTVFFLHGCPETSYSWVNQIEYFSCFGYGIIAPDMLGTGGTTNPDDPESFTWKRLTAEMDELLECQGLEQVIGVGHDIGVGMVSRLQTYYPDRLSAIVFMTLGYTVPGIDLDAAFVEATNSVSLAAFGYPFLGYWDWVASDRSAPIADQHYNMVYGADINWVRNFTEPGALEPWLLNDGRIPFQNEFLTDVTMAQSRTIAQAQGGMDGPFMWYKASVRGYNTADEEALRNRIFPVITKRSMYIGGDFDAVSMPGSALSSTIPNFPYLTIRTVPAKHFLQAEAAQNVDKYLHDFFRSL